MNSYQAQLHDELEQCNILLNAEQERLLLKHLSLVLEANKTLNLTRISSKESGITLHLVDSLILLPFLEETDGMFLDLGTGAGFPGIPLALVTDKQAVLCDSIKKKVAAVEGFLDELGLSGRVITSSERVENLAQQRRNQFGAVVARAVAALPVLVEYATPLLKTHGRLIVTKGRLEDSELESGNSAAKLCGLSLVEHDEQELPHDAGHREILVYEKTGKSRIKLPRRVGKAKTEPLA